jgi:hypothetical protein
MIKKAHKKLDSRAALQLDIDHAMKGLAADWARTVTNLKFQLDKLDNRGLPANVHLLDSLREALALYQQMAAWSHVENKLRGGL